LAFFLAAFFAIGAPRTLSGSRNSSAAARSELATEEMDHADVEYLSDTARAVLETHNGLERSPSRYTRTICDRFVKPTINVDEFFSLACDRRDAPSRERDTIDHRAMRSAAIMRSERDTSALTRRFSSQCGKRSTSRSIMMAPGARADRAAFALGRTARAIVRRDGAVGVAPAHQTSSDPRACRG
jgi:hypothetical protein